MKRYLRVAYGIISLVPMIVPGMGRNALPPVKPKTAGVIQQAESVPSVELARTVHVNQQPVTNQSMAPTQWVRMTATWYDGQEGIIGTGDGITASGAHVQNGVMVAVDQRVIPLGAWMEVKFKNGTMHRYQAQDVGAAIKGKQIGIYASSYSMCITNGIETVWVKWDVVG